MSWPLKTLVRSILLLVFVHTGCVFPGALMVGQALTRQPERDRQQEDADTKLFDEVRKESNLRPLSRISDRKSLEQLVCTAAVTGKVPKIVAAIRYWLPVQPQMSINQVHCTGLPTLKI